MVHCVHAVQTPSCPSGHVRNRTCASDFGLSQPSPVIAVVGRLFTTRPDPTHKTPHSMKPTMRHSYLTHWNPAESPCQIDMDNCTVYTQSMLLVYSATVLQRKYVKFSQVAVQLLWKYTCWSLASYLELFSYRKSDPNQPNPRKWKKSDHQPKPRIGLQPVSVAKAVVPC